jgi:hypothetical protein
MKKFIVSLSFVMLLCLSILGFREAESIPPDETVVVAPAEEAANATVPAAANATIPAD